MQAAPVSRVCARALVVLLVLLALPSLAQAHLYALPAAIVTIPVTFLAVLICWPIKATVTAALLKRRYFSVLWAQLLSSGMALGLFVVFQVAVRVPAFAASGEWREWLRPVLALFILGNYAESIQWGMILAGAAVVLLLGIPSWSMERHLLMEQVPTSEKAQCSRRIAYLNLAFFGLVALVNAVVLYWAAVDSMQSVP